MVLEGDTDLVRNLLREFTARTGRPHFAEKFIDGREFNLPMLDGPDGPQILPLGEMDFSTFPADKPRIIGHRAKWHESSFEYNNTPRSFHFHEHDRPLVEHLKRLALESWRLFGLRGYVRVDFRVDQGGQPWILEINTNPVHFARCRLCRGLGGGGHRLRRCHPSDRTESHSRTGECRGKRPASLSLAGVSG